MWKGSNNPFTYFTAEYGKNQHKQMWSSNSCAVPTSNSAVAQFRSGRGKTKPDCVDPYACAVIEFKPDSLSGKAAGEDAVKEYQDLVAPYYNDLLKAGKTPPESLGGSAVMETLKAKCMRDGVIKLAVSYKTYQVCANQYVCIDN